ncbi:hypothetical protein RZE84_08960 [Mollicutes bacterium LVI A0075]|nr:hypothetical protein RZE84_08960 [Mollicutes bacterium LVI A0075]
MIFEGLDTKKAASKYIKYNTSWNMLKQSRNILHLNVPVEGKYNGISFFDMRTAGLVHFYFNSAIESVVKEFEHCVKVYMSDVYENALDTEKDRVINRLQHTNFNYNKQGIMLDKENLFELYSFATLSELIHVYKILKSKIKSVNMPKIDGNISNVRNTIYHHNNVLIENKQSNNPHVDLERIESLSNQGFSLEITNYLSINYKYNTLRLITDMIDHVSFFLSRDECTAKRKEYMIEKLESDIRSSEYYYNKLEQKRWVQIYYETIQLLIKNIS